jgi:hypothetical protein
MARFTCLEFAFAYFNSLGITPDTEVSFLVASELTGDTRRITLTDDGFWCSAARYAARMEAR